MNSSLSKGGHSDQLPKSNLILGEDSNETDFKQAIETVKSKYNNQTFIVQSDSL